MTTSEHHAHKQKFFTVPMIIGIVISALMLIWGYSAIQAFNKGGENSVFGWLTKIWLSSGGGSGHEWFIPLISGFLLYRNKERISKIEKKIDWKGLLLLIPSLLLFALSFRMVQPRVAMFALPLILLGGTWYLAGWKAAKITLFPFLFLWISIPLPSTNQATVQLQVIATELGHWGGNLLGVDTYVQGTDLRSTGDHWGSFSIEGGCSGMNSLMALFMISFAWAYLAKVAMWKKLILCLSALPIAIIGNGVRITSIVFMAEYVSADFAANTWHDWSGLLLFFPVSLLGLACIHSLQSGEIIRNRNKRKKAVVRMNSQH